MDNILPNSDSEKLLQAMIDNECYFKKWTSSKVEGAKIIETDEYFLLDSGLKYVFANYVTDVKLKKDIEAKIKEIQYYFKEQQTPFYVVVCPNSRPANLENILLNSNFKLWLNEPGMVFYLNALRGKPVRPEGLEVYRVTDEIQMKDWNYVRTTEHPVEFRAESNFYPVHEMNGSAFVGYVEEEPVTISLVYYAAGVAGIYSVMTLPEFRKRGFGKYMTLVPLLEAKKKGFEIAVLKSSLMGKNIYEKLGFKKFCDIKSYLWEFE